MLRRLLDSLFSESSSTSSAPKRTRLGIELLEDRAVPAIIDYTVNVTDDTVFVRFGQNPITGQMAPLDMNNNTSLRAVVDYANANPQNGDWNFNHYNVNLNAFLTGATISLNGGAGFQTLSLNTNFNFLGAGVTIQRSTAPNTNNFRLFSVAANTESHFTGLTLQNGKVAGHGGAVKLTGKGVFEGCTFYVNQTVGMGNSGGAIAVDPGGFLLASNCTFSRNSAAADGGAIAGLQFSLGVSIINCTFTNLNSASGNGGAVSVIGYIPDPADPDPIPPYPVGSLFISGSNINNNLASGLGGGVYVKTLWSADINQTTITDNLASNLGGGLYVLDSTLTMSGGSLTNNTGTNGGGGFYIDAANKTVTLNQVSVTMNKAPNGKGGGGYLLKGTLAGSLTALSGNTSGVVGFDGIAWKTGSTATITLPNPAPPGTQTIVQDP